ncbi:MAG: glycoside hydrolase family 65 [Polyangiaceae bacterium]|nr:glycoside hydrolase family 65 [Polyangiaceae bacterium]
MSSSLDRPFRLIAFDWDGTAVTDRTTDASVVRGTIERLLRCGVVVFIVTGTNRTHLDRQIADEIVGRHKQRLYLATNRGSEVFGFDELSAPVLLQRRIGTEIEERALTATAEAVRDDLAKTAGLEVTIVYDRMNRRKVDLIPLPQWRDPPKSAIGELLDAVEARLASAGFPGGIRGVAELARRAAIANGLQDVRITSDVKHVEIGLTDKSDSIRWMVAHVAGPAGIPTRDILIGGDEFGRVGGYEGSDSRMLVEEVEGATVVSVGREPDGVPAGVLHLPGGPPRFCLLLGSQAAFHPVNLPVAPTADPAWTLIEDGFVLTREHEIESLFSVSNGFVGSRGSLAEGSGLSAPATFIAGVFEHADGSTPTLVSAPDWTYLSGRIEGSALQLESGQPLEHRRVLDLRQGILWRRWRHRDLSGRITVIEGMRLASQSDRRLLIQSVTFSPENYGGVATLEAAAPDGSASIKSLFNVRVELSVSARIERPEGDWTPALSHVEVEPTRRDAWTMSVDLGRTYRIDRVACVRTSREPSAADTSTTGASVRPPPEELVAAHCAAWRAHWNRCDVVVEGDLEAQRAARFAVYHLVSAVNPDDETVSIGARALTGPAYRGHVFWDTEIFMLPFFVFTYPKAARALLMYRYHTLTAARARAKRLGHRGALYAWESADTGEDVTPSFVLAPTGEVLRIHVAEEEQHISADVAYAVWNYWNVSHDDTFLLDAGAEIIIETARFWASRAVLEGDRRYHIRNVIGPDEYHESVDDNAYTNGMAQWNLETAAQVADLVSERWPDRWHALSARLGIDPAEPRVWARVATGLHMRFDASGVIEQFQGYFDLEDPGPLDAGAALVPTDLVVGRAKTQRSQVIKQPDVLMLIHLLWDRFSADVREANFRYYEPRTSHGSSLSPPIHAALAARFGKISVAERYFRQTAEIDLANRMGNAAGGVHVGALGGMWQAIVFGFAGLSISDEGPRFRPHLPPSWRRLAFHLLWRGGPVHAELFPEPSAVRQEAM